MGFDEPTRSTLIGAAGALAPAARRDRDHPRPRRPGDGRGGGRPARLGAEALDLLTALTEADARATSPKAWSSWRAGLVRDLARRARAALDQRRRAAAGGQRRGRRCPSEVRRGGGLDRRRARRRRRAGHRDRPRPGRAARRRRRDASRCSGSSVRAARAWAAGRVRRLGLGGRRRARSTRRCCGSGYDAIVDGPARRGAPGSAPPRRPALEPDGRRTPRGVARRRPCSRCAPPTGPGVVYLVCAALAAARRRGPLGARRHARPAGGRRVLRAGGRAPARSPTTRAAEAAHAVRAGARLATSAAADAAWR